MSDQETEMEGAPAADPAVAIATAMIVLTTLMLLLAFIGVEKLMGSQYGVGMFK
jgi:hypothetical protein